MLNFEDEVFVTREQFMQQHRLACNLSNWRGKEGSIREFADKDVELLYQRLNNQRTLLLELK